MALKYYDKTYMHGFENNASPKKHILEIHQFDCEKSADKLIELADTEGY